MSGEDATGVRHVQVRLTDEEYDALSVAAGVVPIQRFLRGLIVERLGQGDLSPLEGLGAKDRALVEKVAEMARSGRYPKMLDVIRRVAALAEEITE